MKRQPSSYTWLFWVVISSVLLLNMICFDVSIITSPENNQVQYTPDDAYYYLTLARNYARFNTWTFDSGNSVTTGFHLLHAYILTAIYEIFEPSTSKFVSYTLISSFSVITILSILTFAFCVRARNTYALAVFALFISSRTFLLNTVSAMEWYLVVLCASGYYYVYYLYTIHKRKALLAIIFIVGLLGSLSRTDFGLMPFCLFATTLFIAWREKGLRYLYASTAGLAGAASGVIFTLLHNYVYTGDFLQSTARIKLFWSQFIGRSPIPALNMVLDIFGLYSLPLARQARELTLLLFLIAAFRLTIPALKGFVRGIVDEKLLNRERYAIGISGLLGWLGYLLFYSFNSASLQIWYTANFLVPLFVSTVALLSLRAKRLRTVIVLSSFVLLIVVNNVYTTWTKPEWPHQEVMLETGNYLNLNGKQYDGRIGSWNAGIIGYYQGGQIINLDGLVNNDIYPYLVNNNLLDYIEAKDIRYVVDFQKLFHGIRAKRGGYDDPEFLKRLVLIKVFDQREKGWKNMTLYKVAKESDLAPEPLDSPSDNK